MYKDHTSPLKILPPNPRSFYVNLAPINKKTITVNFRAKLANSNIHYLELELFKQRLQKDQSTSSYLTYTTSYNKVHRYRTIFFTLGIVFLVLSAMVFHQHLNFFTVLFGNISVIAKSIIASFSLMLAIGAILMGYSLCIAKEACGDLVEKSKRKLTQAFTRKCIKHGFHRFNFVKRDYRKYLELKLQYSEAIDLINEQQEETYHLLQKIQKFVAIDTEYQELLFNQALSEMNDTLQKILGAFNQNENLNNDQR